VIRGAVLALTLATFAGGAEARQIAPGVYGNVSYSPESGDLGGIELQLTGVGEQARVEFVFCEGWCRVSHTEPVKVTDNGFEFDYSEQYFDQNGRPAPPDRMHVQVRRAGRGVNVTVTAFDDPRRSVSMQLKRLKGRYGLAVADRD
jgi:hypothetical protein